MTNDTVNGSVIVVGGGIVGIACAHYLNEAGFSVTVIDQNRIGEGCSHGNCGHILPSHVLPLNTPGALSNGARSFFDKTSPFKIKLSLEPSFLRWLAEFAFRCTPRSMIDLAGKLQPLLESSSHEYRSITDSLDCNLKQRGLLYVYESQKELDGFADVDRMLNDRMGVQAKRLSGKDLNSLDSAYKDSLAGGFHYEADMHVQPDQLISSWVRKLRSNGVEFIEDCKLESCVRSGNTITGLNTTQGMMKADQFVIATGAWSSKLSKILDCRIPVQAGKGYSLTLPKADKSPEYPAFFLEKGVGITTFENSFRVGALLEIVGYDTNIPADRIAYLRQALDPYLDVSFSPNVKGESWVGWRPLTWDSLPIIGRASNHKNIVLATGHHMLGLTMATGTGKLVSELMSEVKPHIDATPYQPSRF